MPAQFLLGKVGAPNIQTDKGATPLWYAAYYGKLAVAKVLLNTYHADPEIEMASGETPLFVAAKGGHLQIVKLLVENFDANPSSVRGDGMSVLMIACLEKRRETAR